MSYDPTLGFVNYVNTPYQSWVGNAGLKEAGGIVEFVINGQRFTTPILSDGSWSFSPGLFFSDGLHNIAYHYIDAASNHGGFRQIALKVDTLPPPQPVIQLVEDDIGLSQGPLYSGAYTDDTRPKMVGFAEPGSTVRLWKNNQVIATTIAQDNGQFTFEVELGNGNHQLFTTATDRHNQTSPPSEIFEININVNNDPVDLPSLSLVEDNFGPVQKVLMHGDVTDDMNPRFSGVASAELSFVRVYKNGEMVARVAVSDGKWAWESASNSFAVGAWSVAFRGETASGQLSELTSSFNFSVVGKPGVPLISEATDDVGSWQGVVGNNGKTDDTTPTLKGTGQAGSIIYIQYGLSTDPWADAGTAVVDADGKWEFISPELTSEGKWEFRAYAANGHGESAWTSKFSLYLADIAPVSQPVITGVYDNFGAIQKSLINGEVTDDRNPIFSGSAAADIKFVRIYDGMHEIGRVTVNGGYWSWEGAFNQFSSGNHSITVRGENANGKLGSASAVFSFNVITTQPEVPVIIHADDNVGSTTGPVYDNGKTDDTRPTLQGRGVAGSVIHIQYGLSTAAWADAGTAIVDAYGNWTFVSPELTSDGKWEFRAYAANGHGTSGWSSKFNLNLEEPVVITQPIISNAWDDVGSYKGLIGHKGFTDDSTPTLFGTGKPGSIIFIQSGLSTAAWKDVGTAIVGSDGNWQFTSPTLTSSGVWEFRAHSVIGGKASDWSDKFVLNVNINVNYLWDFNDGTLQGWQGFGKYIGHDLQVTREFDGNYSVISNTDDKTTSGYNGTIMYRYIDVIAGQQYDFEFSARRLGSANATPELGMFVDGRQVIAAYQPSPSYWLSRQGSFIATETKSVKVAITNNQGSGTGNDFLIDNIKVSSKPIQESHFANFDDGTLQGWQAATRYANELYVVKSPLAGYGNEIRSGTDNGKSSGYDGPIMFKDIYVEKGQTYQFSFDARSLNGHSNTAKLGLYIENDRTVISNASIRNQEWLGLKGEYTAYETKVIRVVITNGEKSGAGNDFAIDNIAIKKLTSPFEIQHSISEVNAVNDHHDVMTISLSDILQQGTKSLFLDDGFTQKMVQGDKGDVLNIESLQDDDGNWTKAEGNITVAGKNYEVYQHLGQQAELLVQQDLTVNIH